MKKAILILFTISLFPMVAQCQKKGKQPKYYAYYDLDGNKHLVNKLSFENPAWAINGMTRGRLSGKDLENNKFKLPLSDVSAFAINETGNRLDSMIVIKDVQFHVKSALIPYLAVSTHFIGNISMYGCSVWRSSSGQSSYYHIILKKEGTEGYLVLDTEFGSRYNVEEAKRDVKLLLEGNRQLQSKVMQLSKKEFNKTDALSNIIKEYNQSVK